MPTPDFVLELRALVGTRPLWLPGATAVVIKDTPEGQQVLLVRRADTGEWTSVSGIVDPGEHPASAAIREVTEEAGVTAEVEHLVWVTVTDLVTYHNGDQARFLDHVFRCRWLAGDPYPADGEATEAAFFPVTELPPLRTDHRQRLELALAPDAATRLR